MSENEKTPDMVNTTDCLEAVNAFKAMKNFLFFGVLMCLLLLQAGFWLEQLGYIDKADCQGSAGEMVFFGSPCSSRDSAAADTESVSETSNESKAETIKAQAELATADIGGEPYQPDESVGLKPAVRKRKPARSSPSNAARRHF